MSTGTEPRATILCLQVGTRTGPWSCRSLTHADFRVVGAHEPGRFAGRSRYCRSPLRTPPPERSPDEFLHAVDEICTTQRIDAVLPGDDERVTQLLATRLPRPGGAVVVGPTAEQYTKVCDKGNLHESARQAGLDTPRAVIVGSTGAEGEWPPLPSVVKPRKMPVDPGGGLKRSVFAVETATERDAAIATLRATAGDVIVEEQIRGRFWRLHFVTDGAEFASVPVVTLRSFPPGAGMSSVQAVPKSAPPPELLQATQRLIAYLGYRGPGSFQFIERDGRLFIHDVNLRLPSSVALSILAGLDMPRLGVEVALGLHPPLSSIVTQTGVRYAWLYGELRNLQRRLASREAGPALEIVSELFLAVTSPRRVLDQFVLSDPLPTVALAARALREIRQGNGRIDGQPGAMENRAKPA